MWREARIFCPLITPQERNEADRLWRSLDYKNFTQLHWQAPATHHIDEQDLPVVSESNVFSVFIIDSCDVVPLFAKENGK